MQENYLIQKQNEIVLDQYEYQNKMLDKMKKNFPRYLKKRKKEFSLEYNKYKAELEDGFNIEEHNKIPLFELCEFTFKPIIKAYGITPKYSADELAVAYEYYKECSIELNKVGIYTPMVEDYCKLLNISTNQFKEYQTSSNDPNIQDICCKVQDFCYSVSIKAGMFGKTEKVTTIFHNKASNNRRDNEPVQNNTFIQNNTIMSDEQFNDLSNKFLSGD